MKRLSYISVILVITACFVINTKEASVGAEKKTEILIIDVTDKDIVKYGRFPWGRDVHGKALTLLNRYKAKGVLFDMVFSESDSRWPEKDNTFANAIASAEIPVFIPFFFVNTGGGMPTPPYPIQTITVEDNSDIIKSKQDILPSLPQFVMPSAGTGFLNVYLDKKGVLKDIATVVHRNGKYYPFIGITIAAHYFNVPVNEIRIQKNALYFGSKTFRLRKGAKIRPDFGEPFKTYKHYSYNDLLEGQISDNVTGKFAILGFNATGLSDYHVTRTSNHYPGTEIHAVFIDYLLNDL